MNKKLGFYASAVAAATTILFAVSMIIGFLAPSLSSTANLASYFLCMVLSWAYILVTCAYATESSNDRKALSFGSIAIGCLYGVFINIVYFTQLTTVRYNTASTDVLQVITFQSGSLFMNFDIFGYGLMAFSTFLLGLTLKPINKKEKFTKYMYILHGVFLPFCVIAPMLNLFNTDADDNSYIIALIFWCIYFAPIMILSAIHFKKTQNDTE